MLTHARPGETRDALLELGARSRLRAGRAVRSTPRSPRSTSSLAGVAGIALDAPAHGRGGAVRRARRRRHDPARAARLRADVGAGVRRQLRPGRVPLDSRAGAACATGFERALDGTLDVLQPAGDRARWSGRGSHIGAQRRVALHRKVGGRVAELSYAVGGEEVGSVRCDGLVVATPAGSTGYNLANGGPVMAWGVAGMVVSFIAPHSLSARALVIAPDDVARRSTAARVETLAVSVDGRPVGEIAPAQSLARPFRRRRGDAAQMEGSSFYLRLREKFGRLVSLGGCVPSPHAGRPCSNAARAVRPEPAADRGGAPGPRRRAQRDHRRNRRRQDGARARARSAARRPRPSRGSCGRARRRPTSRASSSCLRVSPPSSWPPTPASSCSRGGSGPTGAPAPTWAGARSSSPSCASWPVSCSSFYGQHEHRRLMLGASQLEILDGSLGGRAGSVAARACAAAWSAVRAAREELERLRGACRRARASSSTCSSSSSARSSRSHRASRSATSCVAERDRLRNVEALQRAPPAAPSRRSARRTAGALRALLRSPRQPRERRRTRRRARGAGRARAGA